jgi:hypothetical protein
MKKLFLFLLALLLFVFLAAASAYFYRRDLISKALTKTLQVPSRIQNIEFSKTGLAISGLHIQNPKGCTLQDALLVDHIDIKLCWQDVFKGLLSSSAKKVVIDSITLSGTHMAVEIFNLTASDTNWSRILNALSSPDQAVEPANETSAFQLQINKLLLLNTKLQAKYHVLGKADYKAAPIASIELDNIGTDSPVSTKQLALVIYKVLITEAAKNLNLKNLVPELLLQKMIPLPLFEIREAGKLFENLFKKKENNDE